MVRVAFFRGYPPALPWARPDLLRAKGCPITRSLARARARRPTATEKPTRQSLAVQRGGRGTPETVLPRGPLLRARVLRRLADLAELYGGTVPLPQEALAELAGTSRATVNRVLREQQSAARSS